LVGGNECNHVINARKKHVNPILTVRSRGCEPDVTREPEMRKKGKDVRVVPGEHRVGHWIGMVKTRASFVKKEDRGRGMRGAEGPHNRQGVKCEER